ncbi:MAG: OmpA family protein [Myxococcaceae bacterium]|nr:OmpA family protein [Myxococcaceae bacterium]
MIGNFSGSGHFFGIVSDGAVLTVGTTAINNTTLYAGIFDSATGDPVALASSGTITLSAAGLIGGRITGSFSGTLDDVTPTGCTSSAQCLAGEQCVSGRCVPQGCTSNAQCSSGQVCQAGQCVTVGCTSNAQCGSGQVCQAGQCITAGCTSNAQCGSGQVCQAGQCVAAPACTTDAQCGSGKKCQAGQCVTVTPAACNGRQGDGSYRGKSGTSMVCSAFATSGVNVGQAFAAIGDDGNGLNLFVMDPAQDSAGAILPLTACPSAPGTVAISNGSLWEQTTSGGVTFYAVRPATSASVTFTAVGTSIVGTFSMALVGGGQVIGEFQVH